MHVIHSASGGLLWFIAKQVTFQAHVIQCPVLFCFIMDLTILSDTTEHCDLGIIKVTAYTVSQLLHRPSGWLSTLAVCGCRVTCHDGRQNRIPELGVTHTDCGAGRIIQGEEADHTGGVQADGGREVGHCSGAAALLDVGHPPEPFCAPFNPPRPKLRREPSL